MIMRLTLAWLVVVIAIGLPHRTARAAAPVKTVPSDIEGIAIAVTCAMPPFARDYEARIAASIPLSSAYAAKREAGKGLVHLMNEGGKQTKRYAVPRARIKAIIGLRYEMSVLDRADLIVTASRLILVHTTTTNAGIFTVSDVYDFPAGPTESLDRAIFHGDPQLTFLLDLGLASRAACGQAPAK